MSDTGFGYSVRWPALDLGDMDFVLRRESADRELEQYLDAPPRKTTGLSFLAFDASQDMTARVASLVMRWERQKGTFVTISASGKGIGVALAAPTVTTPWSFGITLPPEIIPAADAGAYSPALVRWDIQPAAFFHFASGAVVKRPSDQRWMIVAPDEWAGWGGSAADVFSVHATFPAAR